VFKQLTNTGDPVGNAQYCWSRKETGLTQMDDEFDRALHNLAALQIKHGIPAILLSMQTAGDVIAKVHSSQHNTFNNYARVHRDTKQMGRFEILAS
jgi:hypothetical protein